MKMILYGELIRLRPKELDDAAQDYAWLSDGELSNLNARERLSMSFVEYLREYTNLLKHPPASKHEFAIETADGKHIGNCAYYGFSPNKKEAEVGITIGDRDYWGKDYGRDAIDTLLSHIFKETQLERLYLKTLVGNSRARTCFEKCGFSIYGRKANSNYSFVLMELKRHKWLEKSGDNG